MGSHRVTLSPLLYPRRAPIKRVCLQATFALVRKQATVLTNIMVLLSVFYVSLTNLARDTFNCDLLQITYLNSAGQFFLQISI